MSQHVLTAVIRDKRGRVLSIGQNSYTKTHPMQKHHAEKVGLPHKIFMHAELSAIVKCKNLSRAHTIQVFRFNTQGKPLLAKPCKSCQSAIEAAGIYNIEYTKGGLSFG